jgi:hypothetical protein
LRLQRGAAALELTAISNFFDRPPPFGDWRPALAGVHALIWLAYVRQRRLRRINVFATAALGRCHQQLKAFDQARTDDATVL